MLPRSLEPTWRRVAEPDEAPLVALDADTLADLPPPAQRWLGRVLPTGVPLRPVVEVAMTGRIRLGGRWLPFTANQILRAGVGFVWAPVVGGRLLRFTGADILGPDDARLEFRLHGLVPVAKAEGPDVARSAAGRLAAETVAWLPAAATPQLGAVWSPVDDERAAVTLATPSGPVPVTVTVADDGRLTAIDLQRWNDSSSPPAEQPFGGDLVAEVADGDGIRLAGEGTVGWQHATPGWDDGRFFEFAITGVRH